MDYSTMREFADTWGLIAMLALFAGILAFTFRPGSRNQHERASQIPFENGVED